MDHVVYPREVLNEIKWRYGALSEARITYVHRGAPGDVLTIRGADIVELGRSFFHTADSSIPYHRIVRIEFRGRTVFGEKKENERGFQRGWLQLGQWCMKAGY